jgi:hypothetical protein
VPGALEGMPLLGKKEDASNIAAAAAMLLD